jgi:hypothetical protein
MLLSFGSTNIPETLWTFHKELLGFCMPQIIRGALFSEKSYGR